MTFRIADDLDFPANAVTQTFALLGKRGSGKTYGAGKLAEALLDGGAQVVVVDPIGTWYGLRLSANGQGAGIPIPVFGGQRGDIPLEPTAGALVAQLVAEKRLSVVLDVSEFTGADQRRFVADFATELLQLKKRNRTPLMTVWDEAQEFVPQYVRPDHARMVGAMEKLVKLGRNFGVGVTLLSQRPQAVHKDVLNQTEVLMVFQLTGPQERKVIEDWVNDHGFGKKEVDELPRLPPGTAFVWSPQWLGRFARVKLGRKRTFDASATPEAGDVVASRDLAPIDLDTVRAAMAATIEEAKASDPKALRAEVERLRAELARAGDGGAAAAERDRLRAETEDLSIRLATVDRRLHFLSGGLRRLLDEFQAEGGNSPLPPRAPGGLPPYPDVPVAPFPARANRTNVSATPAAVPAHTTPAPRSPVSPSREAGGDARMLRALAERHPTALTKRQLGALALLKSTGGTFDTYLSRLWKEGLISKLGGLIGITEAGRRKAGPIDRPTEPRELIAMWRSRLPGKAADMLEWLSVEPVERTKAQLAEHVGLAAGGGTFDTYLSKLAVNGLIERGRGGVRAVPALVLR
jgi:hypothetical protein